MTDWALGGTIGGVVVNGLKCPPCVITNDADGTRTNVSLLFNLIGLSLVGVVDTGGDGGGIGGSIVPDLVFLLDGGVSFLATEVGGGFGFDMVCWDTPSGLALVNTEGCETVRFVGDCAICSLTCGELGAFGCELIGGLGGGIEGISGNALLTIGEFFGFSIIAEPPFNLLWPPIDTREPLLIYLK